MITRADFGRRRVSASRVATASRRIRARRSPAREHASPSKPMGSSFRSVLVRGGCQRLSSADLFGRLPPLGSVTSAANPGRLRSQPAAIAVRPTKHRGRAAAAAHSTRRAERRRRARGCVGTAKKVRSRPPRESVAEKSASPHDDPATERRRRESQDAATSPSTETTGRRG